MQTNINKITINNNPLTAANDNAFQGIKGYIAKKDTSKIERTYSKTYGIIDDMIATVPVSSPVTIFGFYMVSGRVANEGDSSLEVVYQNAESISSRSTNKASSYTALSGAFVENYIPKSALENVSASLRVITNSGISITTQNDSNNLILELITFPASSDLVKFSTNSLLNIKATETWETFNNYKIKLNSAKGKYLIFYSILQKTTSSQYLTTRLKSNNNIDLIDTIASSGYTTNHGIHAATIVSAEGSPEISVEYKSNINSFDDKDKNEIEYSLNAFQLPDTVNVKKFFASKSFSLSGSNTWSQLGINGNFQVSGTGNTQKNLLIIYNINLKLKSEAVFKARVVFNKDFNKRSKVILNSNDYLHHTGYLLKDFAPGTYTFDIQFQCQGCKDTLFELTNDNNINIVVAQLD